LYIVQREFRLGDDNKRGVDSALERVLVYSDELSGQWTAETERDTGNFRLKTPRNLI